MKSPLKLALTGILLSLMIFAPLIATAELVIDEDPNEPSPVIITEIQTGAGTASDEFIELYNSGDKPIDITGWQVRYVSAGGETTSLLAAVTSQDDQPIILQVGQYFTFHTGSTPAEGTGQEFSAGLAKTDKTVAIFKPNLTICKLEVMDAVAWVMPAADPAQTKVTRGEGPPINSTATNTKEKLLRRVQDETGLYVDTNNNYFDFVMTESKAGTIGTPPLTSVTDLATPGLSNQLPLESGLTPPDIGPGSALVPITISGCTVDPPPGTTDPPGGSPPSVTKPPKGGGPSIPASNKGLKSPLLSEFLPNPAKPQTDKSDEFIELYNSNGKPFDLSGYILEVGLKTKKRFVFPSGTKIAPRSFKAFFSSNTRLALSNSGSRVVFADPFGRVLAISEPYAAAKDGHAWVLANGKWQWTTQPTPNALNVISAPLAKKSDNKVKVDVKGAAVGTDSPGSVDGRDIRQAEVLGASEDVPLHPGILALVVVSALLYGAYEYRHDMANKLYQLRSYRAARREARQADQGR